MAPRVALVTDVLHFVGTSSALALANDGFTVLCHDAAFEDQKVREVFQDEHPALAPIAAQSPAELHDAVMSLHGHIDAIVNNDAYPAHKASIEDITAELLTETMTRLVHNAVLRTGALVPLMKSQGSGKIIFVTSAAPLRGLPNYSAYVAARGAANALTVSLAQELARWNIQVNALAPNFIESPTYFPASLMEDEKVRERILSRIPLRRLGKQSEAANIVAFLASDGCGFMTGHIIPLAGGWA